MTAVDQVSVLLENQKGSLARLSSILGEAGHNILALSIAEVDSFGVCRFLLPDPEAAARLLRSRGYTARISPVLVCEVPDRPGGLADLLRVVQRQDVSLEYLYSFVRANHESARLIFGFSDIETAYRALRAFGIRLLGMKEVLEA